MKRMASIPHNVWLNCQMTALRRKPSVCTLCYFLPHWAPSQAIQSTPGPLALFQHVMRLFYLLAVQMLLRLTQAESVVCTIKSSSSGAWAASFGPRQRSYPAIFPQGAAISPPLSLENTFYSAGAFPLWGPERPHWPYQGIPRFSALCFIVFHRCAFFHKLKQDPPPANRLQLDLLWWFSTEHSISEVWL